MNNLAELTIDLPRADPYPSRRADRGALLPRHDPVVYSAWDQGAPLTREQTESYDRNGYLDIGIDLNESEITLLLDELGRLRRDQSALPPDTVIAEPGSGTLRSVFLIHRQSDIFARLIADQRLVRIARFLLGGDVYVHQSRLNYKPGFRGKEFYWHSDFETWHVEDGMPRMRALSMSIALTTNTPLNGPLMVIGGSHRTYVACVGETPKDHYKQSLKKQEYGVPDDDSLAKLAEAGGIAFPTGPAGRVTIFDCNAMHGSNSNITPAPRSNLFVVYNSVENRMQTPFGSMPPRPEFLAAREHTDTLVARTGRLV